MTDLLAQGETETSVLKISEIRGCSTPTQEIAYFGIRVTKFDRQSFDELANKNITIYGSVPTGDQLSNCRLIKLDVKNGEHLNYAALGHEGDSHVALIRFGTTFN